MRTLLLTSDWRLGRAFSRFEPAARERLALARLKTVERIVQLARTQKVDGLVAAGDLFETPFPTRELRDAVASLLRDVTCPVLLVPGDRDPCLAQSVWRDDAFLAALPSHVRVATEERVTWSVGGLQVVAAPWFQHVEAREPFTRLDDAAFAVSHLGPDAAVPDQLGGGQQALLLGGRDALQVAGPQRAVVVPGTPEPMDFNAAGQGQVALIKRSDAGQVLVEPKPVQTLHWEEVTLDSLGALHAFAGREGLSSRVLRVVARAQVEPDALVEFARVWEALRDRDDLVLELDGRGLTLRADALAFAQWPGSVQKAARQLAAAGNEVAVRALTQLAQLMR